jgi:hypothetical protein
LELKIKRSVHSFLKTGSGDVEQHHRDTVCYSKVYPSFAVEMLITSQHMFKSRTSTPKPPPGITCLTIHDLLQTSLDVQALQPKNREFMAFVGAHVDILLDYAFSSDHDPRSKRAFLLLSNPSESVFLGLLHKDRFFVRASEVLARKTPSRCHVSRLAALFTTIALRTDANLTTAVCFLFELLPFIAEPAVSELFASVCATAPHLSGLQRALAASDFAQRARQALECSECSDAKAALCGLVSVCLGNPHLHSCFANERFLDALSECARADENTVLHRTWQALASMATDSFAMKMVGLLPTALSAFRGIRELHSFHASVFEFLGQFVRYAPSCFDASVLNVVLKLLFLFPDATHLQNAVFRFLRNAVRFDVLLRDVFDIVFPALVSIAQSAARNAASANARSFLIDLAHCRDRSPFVDEFLGRDMDFIACEKTVLRRFMVDPSAGYGGTATPRRRSDEVPRLVCVEDMD